SVPTSRATRVTSAANDRSWSTIVLIVAFSSRISPLTSTVIFFERSPAATAFVTSAMLRTCEVRLPAIELTESVRSFHVPETPSTRAWPPSDPSVPTSRATRVTSDANERSWSTIVLMVFFSVRNSPLTSTSIFFERSPLATAVVTSAMLRTWSVRLPAIELTESVRSFQVPATPLTLAWPPSLPSVPTSRATRVTSAEKLPSCSTILLIVLAVRRNSPSSSRPSTSSAMLFDRSPCATAPITRATSLVGWTRSSMSELMHSTDSPQNPRAPCSDARCLSLPSLPTTWRRRISSSAMSAFCWTTALKASATLPDTPDQCSGRRTLASPLRSPVSAASSEFISSLRPLTLGSSTTFIHVSWCDSMRQKKGAQARKIMASPSAGTSLGVRETALARSERTLAGGNAICQRSFGKFRLAHRRTTPHSDLGVGWRCTVYDTRRLSTGCRVASLASSPAARLGRAKLSHHRRSSLRHGDRAHERRATRTTAARAGRQRSFPARFRRPLDRQRPDRGRASGRGGAARHRKRPDDRDAGRQLRCRVHPPGERRPSRRADLARRGGPAPVDARDGSPPRRRRLRGAGPEPLLPRRQGTAVRDRGEHRLRRSGDACEARPVDGLDQRARRRGEGRCRLRRLPRRAAAGRPFAQDRLAGLLHGRSAGTANGGDRSRSHRRGGIVPRRRPRHRQARQPAPVGAANPRAHVHRRRRQ